MVRHSFAGILIICLVCVAHLVSAQLELAANKSNSTIDAGLEKVIARDVPLEADSKPKNDEVKAIPARVDVRCRYQKVVWRPKSKHYFYKIFLAPNGEEFLNWCGKLEKAIQSTCRDKFGVLLEPKYINFARCDLNSYDELNGQWGFTAAIELSNWNDHKKDTNYANRPCMEAAIEAAANEATVDWLAGGGEKCQKIDGRQYRLTYG